MVVPSSGGPVHELCTPDGKVFAVVMTPEEFSRLQAELAALREQAATLQRQKNHYVAELDRILRTWMPVPPSEEEVRNAVDNSHELHKIIEDLEASGA